MLPTSVEEKNLVKKFKDNIRMQLATAKNPPPVNPIDQLIDIAKRQSV